VAVEVETAVHQVMHQRTQARLHAAAAANMSVHWLPQQQLPQQPPLEKSPSARPAMELTRIAAMAEQRSPHWQQSVKLWL
jgi:hypothetical protein